MAKGIRSIFIILVFVLCGMDEALAESSAIVMLTDQEFDPIDQNDVVYGGSMKEYRLRIGDASLATLTMEFPEAEIGQDYEAALALAMKEAAKVGADLLLYISGTEFRDTRAIASITYRCVRTKAFSRVPPPDYLFKTSLHKTVVKVHLRQAPKFDSPSIYLVPEYAAIYVLEDVDETYCEAYVNGRRGFISKNFLQRKP
jgi:hypothetical protein